MEYFDIAKILSYGLSGLSFLLIFMTYNLIAKEQRRRTPRKEILGTIRLFMGLVLLCITIVGFFGVPTLSDNIALKRHNDTLKVENYKINSLYEIKEDYELLEENAQNLSTDSVANIIEKNTQRLDTLSKTISGVAPQQQKEIDELKQELSEKAEALRNSSENTGRQEVRRIVKDFKKLNKRLNKVADEKLKKESSLK